MEKLREGEGVPHARAAAAAAEACLVEVGFLSIPVSNRCCGQSGFRGASSATAHRRVLQRDTNETPARVLLGCCGQSGFRGASSATAHRRVRCLLPGGRPTDRDRLLRLRLLPGGCSRDCTANNFLHRLWSATLSNALCRLVRMEPPVPSALVPPMGTILNDCFSLLVCLL